MLRARFLSKLVTFSLMGIAVPNCTMSKQPETLCTADSGKAFSPDMTPQQICDQFMAALGSKAASIRAELQFSMRGMASVNASHLRSGKWHQLPLLEMAVMDRRFKPSDIDQLARDVLNGIQNSSTKEEN
jgi:hypothetical protein